MSFGTRAGTVRGILRHPPREASVIKRNSPEHYFIQIMALQPSPDFGCYGEQNELYRHSIPDSGKVPIQSPARHWRIAYFYCYEKTGIVWGNKLSGDTHETFPEIY